MAGKGRAERIQAAFVHCKYMYRKTPSEDNSVAFMHCKYGSMAGWSRFSRSLIIYLLVGLIAVQFFNNVSKLPMHDRLQILSTSQDLNRSKIDSAPIETKSSSKSSSKMAPTLKLVLAAKLLNITLAANLVLLANDVSSNPGPATSLPFEAKGLRAFHINIRSLRNKMDELRLFCDKFKPHVLSLNETWLDDSFSDVELSLPGYQLMRRDRDRHGGGIAVYIADNLSLNRLDTPADKLSQQKSKKIHFGAIYRPPNLDASTFTDRLEEMLNNHVNESLETVLLGDFNFDYTSPNAATKNFQRIANLFNLKQLITDPTRITQNSRTLIDLFFTSKPELYVSGVLPIGFSDHSAIFGIRKLHRIPLPPPRIVEARNYKHYDPALFCEDLNSIPWDILELDQTANDAWQSFKDLFLTAADEHAPLVARRVRGRSVPWLTPEIKDLMHQRDHQHKKVMLTNKVLHWSNYKRLRNVVNTKMRKEKCYYSSQLSNDQSSKEMWRTLNKILPKQKKSASRGSETMSATNFKFFLSIAKNLCSVFKDHTLPRILAPRVNNDFTLQEVCTSFVRHELSNLKSSKATGLDKISAKLLKDASSVIAKPITYLINLTISSGEIPSQWKEAKVTPIFKAGKKDDENNYRPISVLPLVSKVMERAVQVQLLAFFDVNKVLSVYQSGFRKKHSTETAVVHLVDHILEHMDKKQLTGAVFIDLKKAFDLVDHKCLLHKLEHKLARSEFNMERNYHPAFLSTLVFLRVPCWGLYYL